MALDVRVCLWLRERDQHRPSDAIILAADAVRNVLDQVSGADCWLSTIEVHAAADTRRNRSSRNGTNELCFNEQAIRDLSDQQLGRSRIWIGGKYPWVGRDQEFNAAPLDLIWYGDNYSSHGTPDFKAFGNISVVLSNRAHFRELHKSASAPTDPMRRNSSMLVQLAVGLATNLDPKDIVVRFEFDGPLSCSLVYHSSWRDYMTDVIRIGRRAKESGFDFQTAGVDDKYVPDARNTILDYGDLRQDYYSAEQQADFLNAIDRIADRVSSRTRVDNIDEIDVLECLTCDRTVNCESVGPGYVLFHECLPYGYIWRPYFALYNLMYSDSLLLDGLDVSVK